MAIEVMELGEESSAQWESFLEKAPSCGPFHGFGWRGVYAKSSLLEPCYLGAFEGGSLIAVLPGSVRKKFGQKVFESNYFGEGGPVFIAGADEETKNEVVGQFMDFLKKRKGAKVCLIKFPFGAVAGKQFSGFNSKKIECFVVDTSQGYERANQEYSRKGCRYLINKARKEIGAGGISVSEVSPNDAESIFALYRETMVKTGAKQRLNIEMLKEALLMGKENISGYCIRDRDGSMIGFSLFVHSKSCSSYFIGASGGRLKELGLILHPLLDALIRESCERKELFVNLGGGPTPGLRTFKKSVGGKRRFMEARLRAYFRIPLLDRMINRDNSEEETDVEQ